MYQWCFLDVFLFVPIYPRRKTCLFEVEYDFEDIDSDQKRIMLSGTYDWKRIKKEIGRNDKKTGPDIRVVSIEEKIRFLFSGKRILFIILFRRGILSGKFLLQRLAKVKNINYFCT